MATDRRKKKLRLRSAGQLIGLLLLAALFALNALVALTSLSQRKYSVSIGMPAPETIRAPRETEDAAATEARRQAARNAVETVYSLDETLADSLVSDAEAFFAALDGLRAEAASLRTASAPQAADGTPLEDDRSWQVVIAQDELLRMLSGLPLPLTDAALGYALLSATDEELLRLKEIVVPKLTERLTSGLAEAERDSAYASILRELQITTLPTRLKELGELLYDRYLQPTLLPDEEATARAKELAANTVTPVVISRGSVIVEGGETVTSGQYQTLTALGLVRGLNDNGLFSLGVAGALLAAYALFGWYLCRALPQLLASSRQMLMLLLIVGLSLLLEWLCFLLDPRVTPALLAVLLCAALLSRQAAQAVNVLLSLAFALMAGGNGSGMLGSASLLSLFASLLGGQAAILVATGDERRGSLIAAGAACGGVSAVVVLAGCAMLGRPFNENARAYGPGAAAAGSARGVLRRDALALGERVRRGDARAAARAAQRQPSAAAQAHDRRARHVSSFDDGRDACGGCGGGDRRQRAACARRGELSRTWASCAAPPIFPRTRPTAGTCTIRCRPPRARRSSSRTSATRRRCCKSTAFRPRCAPSRRSITAPRSSPISITRPNRTARPWRRRPSAIRARARPRVRARSSCLRTAARLPSAPWARPRPNRWRRWCTRSSAARSTTGSLPIARSPFRSLPRSKRASC